MLCVTHAAQQVEEPDPGLVARVADAAAVTLELDDLLDTVHALLVPELADLVGIHLPTGQGLAPYLPPYRAPQPPYPQRVGLARRLETRLAMPFDTELPAVRAFVTGSVTTVDAIANLPQVQQVAEVVARGAATGVVVPLQVGGDVLGTLALARSEGRPAMSGAEIELARRVAARVAVAVAHAQRYDRERGIAAALQNALLPARLADVPGVALAARYVPGTVGLAVGGDWYDVFALPGGRAGVVIGDVMGRGVPAAALMGQLRAATRAYARLDLPPAVTLDLLDGLVEELGEGAIVTAAYVVVDPVRRSLTYARAGHLPPLLAVPGGWRWLCGAAAPPLGTGATHDDVTEGLPRGSLLALCTDGLVEDRGTDLDDGLRAFADAVTDGPAEPEALADHVLATLGRNGECDDDVALLVARIA